MVRAGTVNSGSGSARSEMRLNRAKSEMRFISPIRLRKGRSAAILTLNVTLAKETLGQHKWRFPYQKRPNIFGYKKGWLSQYVQAIKARKPLPSRPVLAGRPKRVKTGAAAPAEAAKPNGGR